jgi:hypothetical protein
MPDSMRSGLRLGLLLLTFTACGEGTSPGETPSPSGSPSPSPSGSPSPSPSGSPSPSPSGSPSPSPSPSGSPSPSPSPSPSALPRDVFRVDGNVGPVIRRSLGAQGGSIVPRSVTDVLALTPSSQSFERRLASVASDGSFQIDLTPGRIWLLAFLDRSRVGDDMLISVFSSETLDSLVPTSSGTLSLGAVAITSSTATAAVSYDALLQGLGLDPALALELGAIDDVCLRYVNPDIDGNGIIDALEPMRRFMLDFHVQLEATSAGRRLTVADAVGQFYAAASTQLRHQGTVVAVAYETAFSAADPRTQGSIRFDAPFYGMSSSPMGPPTDVEFPAGTPINGDALIVHGFSGMNSFGAWGRAGAELPQGNYRFELASQAMTFTHVRTRSAAAFAAAEGFVLPFVRFDQVDPACTSACAIASISYEWRRHSAGAWQPATPEQLQVFAPEEGGVLSIQRGPQQLGQRIMAFLPRTSVTGSIPWAAASLRLEGASPGDVVNTTTAQLCHVGLSVDDALGMRYFVSMDDAPGTCR